MNIDEKTVLYFFQNINCIKIEINIDNNEDINFKNVNIIIDKLCSHL